jgi:predicted tellurium resistance membrane protein TerC
MREFKSYIKVLKKKEKERIQAEERAEEIKGISKELFLVIIAMFFAIVSVGVLLFLFFIVGDLETSKPALIFVHGTIPAFTVCAEFFNKSDEEEKKYFPKEYVIIVLVGFMVFGVILVTYLFTLTGYRLEWGSTLYALLGEFFGSLAAGLGISGLEKNN